MIEAEAKPTDVRVMRRENIRVVVEVFGNWWPGCDLHKMEAEAIEDAVEIRAQIERHVDAESAKLLWDPTYYCPDCGARWTEDSPVFNGTCCDEDVARGVAAGLYGDRQ